MEPVKAGQAAGVVLIVDDSETSATALEVACAGIPGMAVASVSSALDAMRILQGEGGESVCAVLTDVQMPHMDGFELIRHIRGDRRLAAIPIIVITADTDPNTAERTALLGANAYFAKPFSPRAVRETLERLVHGNPRAE